MKRRVLDVSRLPKVAFGHRDPLWWGMIMLVAIEGTMLVLLAVSYLYVSDRTHPFPPTHFTTWPAWIATLDMALWIVAAIPQHYSSKASVKAEVSGMRRSLLVAVLVAAMALAVRVYLFTLLPFRWDSHAYGSVVWAMLGVQMLHGLTTMVEDIVLVLILFRGPVEDKHRVDVHATAPLAYFVVAGVAMIWAIVFLPILLGGGR